MLRSCTIASLALAAVIWGLQSAWGQEDSRDGFSVRQLLSDAWDVTPTARALADEIYQSRSASDVAFDGLSQAYALTLIKQRRYPDALESTQSFLKVAKDDPKLRWTEIWLLLVIRNNDAALERCVALAALAESSDAAEPSPVPMQTIESLGSAIGFLEGPARNSISATVLDQRIARIVGHLAKEVQLEAFARGRKTTLDDYVRRQQQSQMADKQERQEGENQRQIELSQLEQQRRQLADEQAQLNLRQRQLEADVRENISRNRQREADANTTAIALADQAAFMRSRLLLIDADLARLDLQISETVDPALRAILIAQHNELLRVHQLQLADLRAVELQLGTANQSLAFARADRMETQRQAERSQAEFARSRRSIDKALLRANRRQADLASPRKDASARSRAQRKMTTTWLTYMPFPLEAERQRIIDALD